MISLSLKSVLSGNCSRMYSAIESLDATCNFSDLSYISLSSYIFKSLSQPRPQVCSVDGVSRDTCLHVAQLKFCVLR